jgi:hypothetical protein
MEHIKHNIKFCARLGESGMQGLKRVVEDMKDTEGTKCLAAYWTDGNVEKLCKWFVVTDD